MARGRSNWLFAGSLPVGQWARDGAIRLAWPFAASVLIVMRSYRSVITTPAAAIPAMAGEARRPFHEVLTCAE